MFEHLLPRGKTWALVISRTLTRFFEGLEVLPATVRTFIDEVWLDIFPATTRQPSAWLGEFGLFGSHVSPEETLTARWQAQGGQSTSYIEGVLRSAGFDVYVHPWWEYVGQFALVGSGLSVGTGTRAAVTALNGVDVAVIHPGADELRTYRFDGTDWAQVGNGLAVAGGSVIALAALNSTDVAFFDGGNELRTYRFDGTDWVQVGNGLAVVGTGTPALAALNSTDVAFFGSTQGELRTYRFNGVDWVQVGNGLAVAGTGAPALVALGSAEVAFIDATNEELRTYGWDGTDWVQVGNGLAIAGAGTPALARLGRSEVALLDAANADLQAYRFDGTDWAAAGSPLPIAGTLSDVGLVQLRNERVAFIDNQVGELRAYELPRTTRDPLALLGYGVINIQCGVPNAQCGVELAQTGHQLDDGPVLVNQNSRHDLPQPYPPSDPATWPYFIYVAGRVLDARASVPTARRVEFERLLLTICPADRWVGLQIDYT